MKLKTCLSLCLFMASSSALALPNWASGYFNDNNATWNSASGTLTVKNNVNWTNKGKEGFYFPVPNEVKTIHIAKGKKVTGGFRVYNHPNALTISGGKEGEQSWHRSATIFGTSQQSWSVNNNIPDNSKWKYGAIAVQNSGVVTIRNLKFVNARSYHITSFNTKIDAKWINIIDNRGGSHNNSDGFGGAAGSTIQSSYIDTLDDAVKLYFNNSSVKYTTIKHRRNGAPIQLGWWAESATTGLLAQNVTVKGADAGGYNLGAVSWSNHNTTKTKNLKLNNFSIVADSGKKKPHFIQYGVNFGTNWNGTLSLTGNSVPSCSYTNFVAKNNSSYYDDSIVGSKSLKKNSSGNLKTVISGC
ncbi:hypothetical protein [Echinimonas agarilytica]|uniref:Uncharacterized protein n=1 Tax=Echinimonas agarilytica TaxID=1215918 RepID=A0AA41W6L7_9GAMM|nr:hypothetical protein [Echinimonas agarilytica]MCM2679606.1 hypothetical protein [Echinimonas agarilytica]